MVGAPLMPFTCPRCGATSHNPNDEREHYCGRCHAFVDDPRFQCAACHAVQKRNTIRCEQCGKPLVFLVGRDDDGDEDVYRDPSFSERECDRCGRPYRGPAVYCSLECAIADA